MLTSSRIDLSGIFVAVTQHYDMTPFRGVLDGIMGQDLPFLRVRFRGSHATPLFGSLAGTYVLCKVP